MVNTDLLQKAHILTGMLLWGTGSSVTMKLQLDMECIGLDGVPHTFDKPIFQALVMFAGMSLCFFIDKLVSFYKRQTSETKQYQQLEDSDNIPEEEGNVLYILIPTTFDLIASAIMTFGLIYTPASIFQMLRGAMIIFSTILSRIFIGKKIRYSQLTGVIIACCAVVMVGAAAIGTPQTGLNETSGWQTFMGICLILIAQFIQACQLVAEEFFMKKVNIPPMRIVAFEGIFGFLETVMIAVPFAYFMPGTDYSSMKHNSLENTIDSFICVFSNWQMIVIMIVFAVSVFGLNVYGMQVTSHFSSIFRTIMESMRTACVWITMLIIEACWPGHGEGLSWWSILELVGFVTLFTATLIYNRVFQFPCFVEKDLQMDEEEEQRRKRE